MDKFEIRGQRLAALSVLGCLLFNYPFLALFNTPGFLLGIPVLYVYIFGTWGLLILLMAAAIGSRD